MNITLRNASKATIFIHGIFSLALLVCVVIGGFIAIVCLIDYAKTDAMPGLRFVYRFGIGAISLQAAILINMILAE
jgi:hypothetical protein